MPVRIGRAALASNSFGSRGTGDRPRSGCAWESAAMAAIAAIDGENAAVVAAAANGGVQPGQNGAQNGHPHGQNGAQNGHPHSTGDRHEQSSEDLSERSSGGDSSSGH
eukprot:scaffold102029_cov22-Tisochrysis_lutea.AAC.1